MHPRGPIEWYHLGIRKGVIFHHDLVAILVPQSVILGDHRHHSCDSQTYRARTVIAVVKWFVDLNVQDPCESHAIGFQRA